MIDARPLRYAYLSAVTLGCISIAGQIVLLREIMILFYGNELSAGICLFSWLLWTATGAFIGTALSRRTSPGVRSLPVPILAASVLLPATVVLARVAKTAVGISQGEVIGIAPMTAIAVVVLLPFCLVSGSVFPLLIRVGSSYVRDNRDVPARIYLIESIGSAVFGVITALILIRYFDALTIAFVIGAAAAIAAFYVALRSRHTPASVVSSLVVLLFILESLFSVPDVGAITRKLQWEDFDVIESTDSIYGNLTVTRAGSQTTVYDSGILSFTYPDVMNSELGVIYPLLLSPRPVRVLLVGGGISSTLSQILKHPSVERIDYVELDPALIDLGMRDLPPGATLVLSDARVHIIHEDGRLFVREARDRYDVIIVNMADPVNARINRYFTREFFNEAGRILAPGGVFSISVGSSEEIISPVLASFLASISRTLASAFPHTAVIPGGTAFFVASETASRVDINPELMAARMKKRGIANTYVTEYYLLYQLSDERLEYIRRSIDSAKTYAVNTDLSPTVYYYDMVLRSYDLSPGIKIALAEAAGSKPYIPAAVVILTATLYGGLVVLVARRRPSLPAVTVAPAALASGFSEIALTVVIIIAFQTFRGYVYSALGLIVSAFMVGLAVGTAAVRRPVHRSGRPWRLLVIVQLLYAALCLVVLGTLVLFSTHGSAGWSWGPAAVFTVLNMFCGTLAAFHYVTAVRSLMSSGVSPASGGWVYGMNLAGASAGAILGSVVLIPLWGLPTTILLIVMANVFVAVVVGIGARFINGVNRR